MPDNVDTVKNVGPIKVDQVFIGSCTNSSYQDMMRVARILKGKTVHPDVSLVIGPGSKQVLTMLARNGALAEMLGAGARILESACGPCIGMGQSPNSKGVSLRTFNRNFEGRSGTRDAMIYLVSPETAAYSALCGYLANPRELGTMPLFELPEKFHINDNMITKPADESEAHTVEILRGPNIKEYPATEELSDTIRASCSLKVGDNITTDHIMPAGAKILPLRSNIPEISKHCFTVCDKDFPERAKALGQSIIVGGVNYGQGSSREHAALAPLYLGVKAVIAKSFARIHRQNLINAGILPLELEDPADYDSISQGDVLEITGVISSLEGNGIFRVKDNDTGRTFSAVCRLSDRMKAVMKCGGLLKFTKQNLNRE
jgi:aconitate hydratase